MYTAFEAKLINIGKKHDVITQNIKIWKKLRTTKANDYKMCKTVVKILSWRILNNPSGFFGSLVLARSPLLLVKSCLLCAGVQPCFTGCVSLGSRGVWWRWAALPLAPSTIPCPRVLLVSRSFPCLSPRKAKLGFKAPNPQPHCYGYCTGFSSMPT